MTPAGLTPAAACSFRRACLNSPVIRCKADSQGSLTVESFASGALRTANDLCERGTAGSPFPLVSAAGSQCRPFNHTPQDPLHIPAGQDRKSVVYGKSVHLSGRRFMNRA